MTDELAALIAEAVDSHTKLELVAYFVANPHAVEDLAGLAARLGRDPVEVDTATRELTAAGFLRVTAPQGFGPQAVFQRKPQDVRAHLWNDLAAAYAGADREQVLRLVGEADRQSVARRAVAERRLHDLQTRFLAMVSDQLRHPATTIMGLAAALLARPDELSEAQTQSLELIMRHAQVLTRLVEDLLLSARLKDGEPLPLNPAPFDLVNLAREVLSDFSAENDEYRWSLQAPEEPLLVEADRAQLRQVFGVLVRNALKFSPPGTAIAVGVGGDEQWVWGAVEDEGPGLSPADQGRIFNLFYQAETDATRLSGGLGLGLYLAQVIVQAHGGEIGTEAKRGPGLRVVFRLPRRSEQLAARPPDFSPRS